MLKGVLKASVNGFERKNNKLKSHCFFRPSVRPGWSGGTGLSDGGGHAPPQNPPLRLGEELPPLPDHLPDLKGVIGWLSPSKRF